MQRTFFFDSSNFRQRNFSRHVVSRIYCGGARNGRRSAVCYREVSTRRDGREDIFSPSPSALRHQEKKGMFVALGPLFLFSFKKKLSPDETG